MNTDGINSAKEICTLREVGQEVKKSVDVRRMEKN